MATQPSITDITQAQYNTAEQSMISVLRVMYPSLDLRAGTVLRNLLVQGDATLNAWNTLQVAQLQGLISLVNLAANPAATADDVNAILANFNMTQKVAVASSGIVRVVVNSVNTYTLSSGFIFKTTTGLQFTTTATLVAAQNPVTGQVALQTAADGTLYFLAPVTAVSTGSASNIAQGTALTAITQLFGFVSSTAYQDFTLGSNGESIAEAIARIPAAVSHRGLVNTAAIQAQLGDKFTGTDVNIEALSVQGYGSTTQLRDKHNVFGTAVGGRVDLYIRTFAGPQLTVITKTGTRLSTGVYQFSILPADAPAFIAIASITDSNAVGLGSYAFTEVRSPKGLEASWHDISATVVAESAFTVYQSSVVTVTGVPDSEATHVFSVTLYAAPGVDQIQAYIDDPSVRNVGADFLAHSPLTCFVSCSATVYYSTSAPVDVNTLASAVANYINGRSFVPRLTRSELASILFANGVTRLDLGPNGMQLQGRILDAQGVTHTLKGDALDLTTIISGPALLAPETTVFAAQLASIQFTGVSE